jgi:hypothetical protein
MRFTDAVSDAGITYRQADWWRQQGWVRSSAEGSGTVSEISRREALVMERMGILTRAGMLAGKAAVIARSTVERDVSDVDLPGGLRLTFGVRS